MIADKTMPGAKLNLGTTTRVCVVGSGTRFLSGISYYTNRLANSLSSSHEVSVILMRQLLPTQLYPGRKRVGVKLTDLSYNQNISVFDGVDWFWWPSIIQAIAFMIKQRPEVMVFQWWTGTVLHSYLFLAIVARLLGAKVVIEFHEVQDTGEARMPLARAYVGLLGPLMINLSSGFVVHSEFDRPILEKRYPLANRPVALIPHGPYDHHRATTGLESRRDVPSHICNLLYFGVIRPYKGLEDLIKAFDAIPESEIEHFWLTVVGETWEGWTLPNELIEKSRYRQRITFINRYVRDEEVASFFAGADAVVLPYHRSSASGPLHTALSHGLPVVVTQVGGLVEAVSNYEGAILVPPQDVNALRNALDRVVQIRGKRYSDPHSWENTLVLFTTLFSAMEEELEDFEMVA